MTYAEKLKNLKDKSEALQSDMDRFCQSDSDNKFDDPKQMFACTEATKKYTTTMEEYRKIHAYCTDNNIDLNEEME